MQKALSAGLWSLYGTHQVVEREREDSPQPLAEVGDSVIFPAWSTFHRAGPPEGCESAPGSEGPVHGEDDWDPVTGLVNFRRDRAESRMAFYCDFVHDELFCIKSRYFTSELVCNQFTMWTASLWIESVRECAALRNIPLDMNMVTAWTSSLLRDEHVCNKCGTGDDIIICEKCSTGGSHLSCLDVPLPPGVDPLSSAFEYVSPLPWSSSFAPGGFWPAFQADDEYFVVALGESDHCSWF